MISVILFWILSLVVLGFAIVLIIGGTYAFFEGVDYDFAGLTLIIGIAILIWSPTTLSAKEMAQKNIEQDYQRVIEEIYNLNMLLTEDPEACKYVCGTLEQRRIAASNLYNMKIEIEHSISRHLPHAKYIYVPEWFVELIYKRSYSS